MNNVGTFGFPVVASLPVSGALGQVVTLSTDNRNYAWDQGSSTWRALGSGTFKVESFAVSGGGPYPALTFTATSIAFVALDGGLQDPATDWSFGLGTTNRLTLLVSDPSLYLKGLIGYFY